MRVVVEAGVARAFAGYQAAAGRGVPLEAQRLQAGPAEVGLQHEGVVAGA